MRKEIARGARGHSPPPSECTICDDRLVWRFRSPHHSCGASEMRISEPKPHWINELLVSLDSEVRKRTRRTMMRTSESGH
jgi:hypothetical protein